MKPAPVSIPVATAMKWMGAWETSDHKLEALHFTFDADELRAVLSEEGVVKVRFYLAIDNTDNSGHKEKLLFIGVNKDGNTIIDPPGKEKDKAGGEEDEGGTGIYDFSHPCPPLC